MDSAASRLRKKRIIIKSYEEEEEGKDEKRKEAKRRRRGEEKKTRKENHFFGSVRVIHYGRMERFMRFSLLMKFMRELQKEIHPFERVQKINK